MKYSRRLKLRSRSIIVIVAIFLIVSLFTVVRMLSMKKIFTMIQRKNIITATNQIFELSQNSEDFSEKIAEIESKYSIYVEIYEPADSLVYTSVSNTWVYNTDIGEDREFLPRVMNLMSHYDNDDGSYFEIRKEHFSPARYLVYDMGKFDKNVVSFYSLDALEDNAKTTSMILLGISFVLFIVVLIIVTVYNFQIIFPIEKINAATKRISKMDFSRRLPEFRVRDLSELGFSINALSDSLKQNLRDLKAQNEILSNQIEKDKTLDIQRKEFIANASHELKTPLAIIQSYAEGIKYDDSFESVREYCDIILDESEKMNNLIVRMLNMSKHEQVALDVSYKEFDVSKWLTDYLNSYKILFEKNGISFECEIEENLKGFGNESLLTEVIMNYLNNAVSHCENEKIIKVNAFSVDDEIKITVFNTGKQIDESDIPFLWDSFYRVDKAHSRANGRFGLGLSIVKIIQSKHGENYGVDNKENGVEFFFFIKSI